MANKRKLKIPIPKRDPDRRHVKPKKGEKNRNRLARLSLEPNIKGAVTVQQYSRAYGELDLTGLSDELVRQAQALGDGDLTRAEGMLMIHAQSLDAICNNLAEWAINAKHLDKLDRYLRLAVKAHAQCRTTMQTLVKVKYLKQATFIRQANIAGQQQVNNATNPEAEPRAREISPNKTNELLEDQSYEPQGIRMDSRAPITTGCNDSELAPMGDLDWAANRRR
jgi:hypothetical protein